MGWHWSILVGAFCALLGSGCALRPAPLPYSAELEADRASARFVLEYRDVDFEVLDEMNRALRHATEQVAGWGEFRKTVSIKIYPTHEDLERAVDRIGYPWLRAWARFRVVYLQSPRTWGGSSYERRLKELLAHELTHVLMYQLSATEDGWRYKGIPTWFREGMASVTAAQGYRRLDVEEIAERLSTRPGVDPVHPNDRLYKDEPELVYSSAHHLFDHLQQEHGADAIRKIMATMRSGSRFDRAFEVVVGASERSFADRWLAGVRGSQGGASDS